MTTRSIEVPGYEGRGTIVHRNETVRIVNVDGAQIGDLFLIALDDPMEVFSPAVTRLVNFTPFPRVNEPFFSNRRRPMLTFLKDTSPGIHDMTFAPCDLEFYVEQGAGEGHPSCRANFESAMQAIGKEASICPDPVNLFQNSPVDASGNYVIGESPAVAGDYVEFRAEMDLILVLTACSVDMELEGVYANGRRSTPLRIEVMGD